VQIDNQTDWKTDDLRRFVTVATEKALLDGSYRNNLRVEISYCRHSRYHRADCPRVTYWYGRPRFNLMVVKGVVLDKCKLAKLIMLALSHCQRGIKKFNKECPHWGWPEGWRNKYTWALELPLERKPSTAAPRKGAVVHEKLKHAQEMVNVWDHKVQVAMNKKSAWLKRFHRYDGMLKKIHDDELSVVIKEVLASRDEDEGEAFDLTYDIQSDTVPAVKV